MRPTDIPDADTNFFLAFIVNVLVSRGCCWMDGWMDGCSYMMLMTDGRCAGI